MAERVAVTFAATAFYRLFGGLTDVALLLILLAWRNWQLVSGAVDPVVLSWAAGVVRYGVLYVVGYRLLQRLRSSAEQTQWEGLGKPLILPCRTTHTRMFPKVHSFSYSYLVVGIPVGWEGSAGAMVSSGFFPGQDSMASWLSAKRTRTKAWFHVDPSNYLERGNAHLGLRGKLDEYLRSQVSGLQRTLFHGG